MKLMSSILGLAMTGGGARGAYQAGVLQRISEIKSLRGQPGPFEVIGAASAGAVNGTVLATGNDDFYECAKWLSNTWCEIKTSEIYRSDVSSLLPRATRWIKDLSIGPLAGGDFAHSLLDSAPLESFLKKNLKTENIQKNIEKGNLRAITVATTNYSTGKTFLFVQGMEQKDLWTKSRQLAISAEITVDHISASAAIPLVFSPVKIKMSYGNDYFGDGCLRLTTPLSPIIRLKADRILAIGVRSKHTANVLENNETPPSVAQILGTALNAIFMDHLDTDVDHLKRLNKIIIQGNLNTESFYKMEGAIKVVSPLIITPSVDLGHLASSYHDCLPRTVRYLMAGLGTQKGASDLASYLLFDTAYTKTLVDIGYKDAHNRIDEIEAFIRG